MINDFKILINGHSRFGLDHTQKFSLVMTIDISKIDDKQSYIDDFTSLNESIMISGINTQEVVQNINEKNSQFITINNEQELDIEELQDIF